VDSRSSADRAADAAMSRLRPDHRLVVTGVGDIGSVVATTLVEHGAEIEVWDSDPDALGECGDRRQTRQTTPPAHRGAPHPPHRPGPTSVAGAGAAEGWGVGRWAGGSAMLWQFAG
ncbi:MAG: hypothetical protein OXG47_07920, partial [bacterium]|nr:hypothetical protein [bacterium]